MKAYYRENRGMLAMMFALTVAFGVLSMLGYFDPLAGGVSFAMAAAAAAGTQKEPERIRKITLGTIKVQPDIEKLIEAPGKRMDLCDLFGIATRAKPGSSQHGPYVAFVGTFRAVRLSDKAVFEANKIILPQFIEEELFAAFSGELSANVEFAMRISAKFDKDAATKYVYDMVPLIKPKENAQLAGLLEKVKEAQKTLPAPKA